LRGLYAELAALLEESVLEHVEHDGAPAPLKDVLAQLREGRAALSGADGASQADVFAKRRRLHDELGELVRRHGASEELAAMTSAIAIANAQIDALNRSSQEQDAQDAMRSKTQFLAVTQRDDSVWGVPVAVIAELYKAYWINEFDGDFARYAEELCSDKASFDEDVSALVEEDWGAIDDWAETHLKWADLVDHAVKLKDAPPLRPEDFEDAWRNGLCEVVEA